MPSTTIARIRATPVTVPLEAPLRHSNGAHWGRFVRTIVEVETDKITNELLAPVSGILAKILVQAEETVEVGAPLAIIATTPEEAVEIRNG